MQVPESHVLGIASVVPSDEVLYLVFVASDGAVSSPLAQAPSIVTFSSTPPAKMLVSEGLHPPRVHVPAVPELAVVRVMPWVIVGKACELYLTSNGLAVCATQIMSLAAEVSTNDCTNHFTFAVSVLDIVVAAVQDVPESPDAAYRTVVLASPYPMITLEVWSEEMLT